MLRVNGIKKKYQNFELDCSLEVADGCITALIGKNGAGKSTTFKAILNLINVDDGDIELFGKNINDYNVKDMNQIGYVLSDSFFSSYFDIRDIKYMLKNFYINFDEIMFDNLILKMNLPTNKNIKDFSTGMKAKIKLICAITHGAKFLLLDEITAGLDVVARDEVLDLIREYMIINKDASVLISSHISSDIETLCDDFYLIDNGKIIAYDTIDNVLNEYAIIKLNLADFELIDKEYVITNTKEEYGYKLLVKEKQYFLDNYKHLVIEKANIDEIIKMMIKGD